MGAIDCPICEQVRHINDEGEQDHCWACGWTIPVNSDTGEYRGKSEWPAISETERKERKRCAARRIRE